MIAKRQSLRGPYMLFLLVVVLVSVSSLPALVSGQKKRSGRPAAKIPDLVWPMPPERPRIRYLGSLTGSMDVQPPKKKGWLTKLINEEETQRVIGLGRPAGIAIDSQGRIYVADTFRGAVFIFDLANKTLDFIGADGRGKLANPYGIAIDKNDNIYVSDTKLKRVNAYDKDGNLTASLTKIGEETIVNPAGLAIDGAGNRLLIADSRGHKIFAADLNNLNVGRSFGKRGEADTEFNFPNSITVDAQRRIYVTDMMNFCVKVFDSQFKFLRRIGEHGTGFGMFDRPKGVALDSQDHIYVVDSSFSNFQIFNDDGQLLLFVGGFGSEPGLFRLPSGIHVDGKDRIYISDQVNSRIQIFQFMGGD
jgi:sugar lactone lactonase YvrE